MIFTFDEFLVPVVMRSFWLIKFPPLLSSIRVSPRYETCFLPHFESRKESNVGQPNPAAKCCQEHKFSKIFSMLHRFVLPQQSSFLERKELILYLDTGGSSVVKTFQKIDPIPL